MKKKNRWKNLSIQCYRVKVKSGSGAWPEIQEKEKVWKTNQRKTEKEEDLENRIKEKKKYIDF